MTENAGTAPASAAMSREDIARKIRVGTRFRMHGSEFEVCFSDGARVRYAASASGKQITTTLEECIDFIADDGGAITFVGLDEGAPGNTAVLSPARYAHGARIQSYVRELFSKLGSTWKRSRLKEALKEITDERNAMLPPDAKKERVPCPATAYDWRKDYRTFGGTISGLAGNFHQRGPSIDFDSDVELLVAAVIEEQHYGHNVSIKDCRAYVVGLLKASPNPRVRAQISDVPTARALQKRLRKEDPYRKLLAEKGAGVARRLLRAAARERDYGFPFKYIQADGFVMDLFVICKRTKKPLGRAYATALVECATRYPLTVVAHAVPFCSATVQLAVRKSITEDHDEIRGAGKIYLLDNGMADFVSAGLKRLIKFLNADIEYGSPYSPNHKAIVERLIREFQRFLKTLPGKTFGPTKDVLAVNPEGFACIYDEDLEELLAMWIRIKRLKPHARTHRAPLSLMRELIKGHAPITYPAEEASSMARTPYDVKVNGGRVTRFGLHWWSDALETYETKCRQLGQKSVGAVLLLNNFDLSDALIEYVDQGKRRIVQLRSTRPAYTDRRSLTEHLWAWEALKRAGIDDLHSLEDYELESLVYQMRTHISRLATRNKKELRKYSFIVSNGGSARFSDEGAEVVGLSKLARAAARAAWRRPSSAQPSPAIESGATPAEAVADEQDPTSIDKACPQPPGPARSPPTKQKPLLTPLKAFDPAKWRH